PMSFAPSDRPSMSVGFPSKLAEYCAAGKPVLVWGPEYCSAVRWAEEHPGFAEVVKEQSEDRLFVAVRKLAADPIRRQQMGMRSIDLARKYFSHERTFTRFMEAINRPRFLSR